MALGRQDGGVGADREQFIPKSRACKLLLFVVVFELVVDLTIEVRPIFYMPRGDAGHLRRWYSQALWSVFAVTMARRLSSWSCLERSERHVRSLN